MHTFAFCLFKPITHVCTQGHLKMSWVLPLPVPTPCPQLWNTSPCSAFTMPLYLVFGGRWMDLAYGILGVWALDSQTPVSPSHFLWMISLIYTQVCWGPTHVSETSTLGLGLFVCLFCFVSRWVSLCCPDWPQIPGLNWFYLLSLLGG
jgi:hypothetical protein